MATITQYNTIELEYLRGVAIIRFNRPDQRNAWNVPMVRETIDAIQRSNNSPEIGAIILTGNGAAYCAGADLKHVEKDPVTGRRLSPASLTMGKDDHNWIALLRRSKPTIAAINGPAVGIGATHILAADIRIAADSAMFAFPFLKLGAMPECGSTALLGQLIGYGRAVDLCLRSRTIDARQALDIGLVSEVFPQTDLADKAFEIAAEVASVPTLQMALTRQMFTRNTSNSEPAEIMRVENEAFIELLRARKRDKPL